MPAAARSHRHGAFVWFTHLADHPGDAMSFYSEVFGWTAPPDSARAIARDRENADHQPAESAVIKSARVDLRPAHAVGPGWVSWLSVADVHQSVQRAAALGATVLLPAQNAPPSSTVALRGLDVERFALVEDPGGARVFLVTTAQSAPEPDPPHPGEIFAIELWAPDVGEASAFYCDLMGYERAHGDDEDKVTLTLDGEPVVCVVRAPTPFLTRSALNREPGASQWLPYVVTDDVDNTVSRARRIGGSLVGDIVESVAGARSAVLLDHGGQAIATIAPAGL